MIRKRLPILATLSVLAMSTCATPVRAAHLPHSQPAIRVGIVLFDGVEPIDYAGPYEIFAQAGFSVATVSADGKAVTGMGLKVTPDYSFANAPPFDILVVPGGDVGHAEHDRALLDFIRQRSIKARQVLSVCTGAYVLAASGLLDGLEATTYIESVPDMAASYPKVHVLRDARWVDDGKIVTSAGLTTGIDASLHILAKLEGLNVARSIAIRMEYAWQPDATAGFIRGDLADQYLPDLDGVALPKGAHVEPIVSLGNTQSWRMLVRIETTAPPQALLTSIDHVVGQTPGWHAQPSQGPHHWRNTEDGKLIDLSFSSSATAPNGVYDLLERLQVQPQ